ncbi:hypothetical protein O7606_18485 [Micromonospora sp. WMMD882]|uniref:hypothetical protein n=1 Tax=Micromonospora sp. WMMD882 TaxID=3015151 RepID=UPI00248B9A41|nr:hypothetical protein [Micromonospora sp. WMMD882]WBB78216.1 hypothetical protein O7606_18485 [Micromonospora sp. WMMD882]
MSIRGPAEALPPTGAAGTRFGQGGRGDGGGGFVGGGFVGAGPGGRFGWSAVLVGSTVGAGCGAGRVGRGVGCGAGVVGRGVGVVGRGAGDGTGRAGRAGAGRDPVGGRDQPGGRPSASRPEVGPAAGRVGVADGPTVLDGRGLPDAVDRGDVITTGPREGVGMNGVLVPGGAVPPTVAEPVLIAAMIGIDAVPASSATVNR